MVKWDDNKVIVVVFVFLIGLLLIGFYLKTTGKVFLGNNEFSLDFNVSGRNVTYVGNNEIALVGVSSNGDVRVSINGYIYTWGIPPGGESIAGGLSIRNVDFNFNTAANKSSAILRIIPTTASTSSTSTSTTSTTSTTSSTTSTTSSTTSTTIDSTLCGNGVLDTGEECDYNRSSNTINRWCSSIYGDGSYSCTTTCSCLFI